MESFEKEVTVIFSPFYANGEIGENFPLYGSMYVCNIFIGQSDINWY